MPAFLASVFVMRAVAVGCPIRFLRSPQTWATFLAWCWLFTPLVWIWPTTRSLGEAALSALLLMGVLLSRAVTRAAVTLLWLSGLCFLGYFFAVHSLPDEFFWQSLLGSNANEALEFASAYRLRDWFCMLAWAVPAIWAVQHLWRVPRALRARPVRALAWGTVVLWTLWAAVSVVKGYGVYGAFQRVDRIYPLMAVKSWERYAQHAALAHLQSDNTPPAHPPKVDVLVVVLGESASAHRWSLLGYSGQDTNAPLAAWQEGVLAMPLTTNGNNTAQTLPVIVAGQSLTPIPTTTLTSYIDQGRAAGFRNVVLANQQAPGFAHAALRGRSDSFMQLQDGQYDGALTPGLKAALQEAVAAKQPLVVTLHTYGSHPRIESRTPSDAARWDDPYDNSQHYTSTLLAQWIAQLQALPNARAALLYVSDHGQDFPVCGGRYVHGNTRSTYEVPFLLWSNDRLREQQSDWWKIWQDMAMHAVDTEGVPRYNTLLPARAIAQLLGYNVTLPSGSKEAIGSYPPAADSSLCVDWHSRVQTLHPAAVR